MSKLEHIQELIERFDVPKDPVYDSEWDYPATWYDRELIVEALSMLRNFCKENI